MVDQASVLHLQTDRLAHPAWSGRQQGVSIEDERLKKLLGKYETWGATLAEKKS